LKEIHYAPLKEQIDLYLSEKEEDKATTQETINDVVVGNKANINK